MKDPSFAHLRDKMSETLAFREKNFYVDFQMKKANIIFSLEFKKSSKLFYDQEKKLRGFNLDLKVFHISKFFNNFLKKQVKLICSIELKIIVMASAYDFQAQKETEIVLLCFETFFCKKYILYNNLSQNIEQNKYLQNLKGGQTIACQRHFRAFDCENLRQTKFLEKF